MGAVTYPHEEVKRALHEHFVSLRVNEYSKDPAAVAVLRAYRLLWSPGFIFLDAHGNELRRLVGYLPPEDFLAELHFVLGMVAMLQTKYAESFDEFRVAADRYPQAPVCAEALYWAGIAAFRRDGRKIEVVRQHWEEIRRRFPQSIWWKHADVFDVTPPGRT
jgi:hypothetical protein